MTTETIVLEQLTEQADTEPLTWGQLIEAEPRLVALEREAKRIKRPRTGSFCANAIFLGWGGHPGIKPRLSRLVGWFASKDAPAILRSHVAYQVAYQHLYNALPDCRDCLCM